jgi:hypothetical protein
MDTLSAGNEDVIGQLPSALQELMRLERFHLHQPELYQKRSRDPTFDPRYFPQNCAAFRLPCFFIAKKHAFVYGKPSDSPNELRMLTAPDEAATVLLPIHPTDLSCHTKFLAAVDAADTADRGNRIWAVPTSSTRTLLAWPDEQPEKAVFLKVSLRSPIFGDRRLDRMRVGRSVGLSQLIEGARATLPNAFDYLPERFGLVVRRTTDCGAIVRSLPDSAKGSHLTMVPLFALLSGGDDHPPFALRLFKSSGMTAIEFLEQVLCAPFTKLWLELTMRHGIVLEAHSQDLMLALSPGLIPMQRFVYRDFEGLQVDWELRMRRGLPAPAAMPEASCWHETYNTWGYPHSQLVWHKWATSLTAYMHFVVNEFERSVRRWEQLGLLRLGTRVDGQFTMIFSAHLLAAVEKMFGVKTSTPYDVYRETRRFVLFLAGLRRELLQGTSS